MTQNNNQIMQNIKAEVEKIRKIVEVKPRKKWENFHVLVSLILTGISIYVAVNSFNITKMNSELVYEYQDVQVTPLDAGEPIMFHQKGVDYDLLGFNLNIKIKVKNGEISNIYLISKRQELNNEGKQIVSYNFQLLSGSNGAYNSKVMAEERNGRKDTLIYVLIKDIHGSVIIDCIQLTDEAWVSINKSEPLTITSSKRHRNYNLRLLKEAYFVASDDMKNVQWQYQNTEGSVDLEDIDMDEMKKDVNMIREKYYGFYGLNKNN